MISPERRAFNPASNGLEVCTCSEKALTVLQMLKWSIPLPPITENPKSVNRSIKLQFTPPVWRGHPMRISESVWGGEMCCHIPLMLG